MPLEYRVFHTTTSTYSGLYASSTNFILAHAITHSPSTIEYISLASEGPRLKNSLQHLMHPVPMGYSNNESSYGNAKAFGCWRNSKNWETVSSIEGHACHNDVAVAIRITALNDLSDCPAGDYGEAYARNQQAHGGSLETDMWIVGQVPADSIRMNAWKDAIHRFYGIEHSELANI